MGTLSKLAVGLSVMAACAFAQPGSIVLGNYDGNAGVNVDYTLRVSALSVNEHISIDEELSDVMVNLAKDESADDNYILAIGPLSFGDVLPLPPTSFAMDKVKATLNADGSYTLTRSGSSSVSIPNIDMRDLINDLTGVDNALLSRNATVTLAATLNSGRLIGDELSLDLTVTVSTRLMLLVTVSIPSTITYEGVAVSSPISSYIVAVTGGRADKPMYEAGEIVTITADPDAHTQFMGWTISPEVEFTGGTTASSDTAKFIMPDGVVYATANFEAVAHDISLRTADGVDLSSLGYTFAEADLDYTPEVLTVTITNSGTVPTGNLNIRSNRSTIFKVSEDFIESLPVAGTATFTVTPVSGLDIDRHSGTITVESEDGSLSKDFTVSFTVIGNTSIASNDREIPGKAGDESAVVAPVNSVAFEMVAGPNPVSRAAGTVDFFCRGGRIGGGSLTIYDAAGNVVRKISIRDDGVDRTGDRRVVGSWDLRDAKGRLVPEGAYLAKGAVTSVDGKKQTVSLMIGVR